jgi:hypothetical protein
LVVFAVLQAAKHDRIWKQSINRNRRWEIAVEYKKILKNITGISTPLFGVQWNPPSVDSDVAREIIVFLEDRRVLYGSEDREGADYCRQSVEQIRGMLTQKIPLLSGNKDVLKLLKSLRSQCRRFCDEVGARGFPNLEGPVQKSILKRELLKLREVSGIVVGSLAVSYGIDVEDELASIIPFKTYEVREQ